MNASIELKEPKQVFSGICSCRDDSGMLVAWVIYGVYSPPPPPFSALYFSLYSVYCMPCIDKGEGWLLNSPSRASYRWGMKTVLGIGSSIFVCLSCKVESMAHDMGSGDEYYHYQFVINR